MNRLTKGLILLALMTMAMPLIASSQPAQPADLQTRPLPQQRELLAGELFCTGQSGNVFVQLMLQGTRIVSDQGFFLRRDGAGNPSVCRQLVTEFAGKATSFGCTSGEVSGSLASQIKVSIVCERERNGLVRVLGNLSREFITLPIQ